MFLNTSRDLLNIVLAFSVVWLTVFLCWFLYYLIVIVRTVAGTFEDFRKSLEAIQDTIRLIREKLESTSTYLGLLVDVVKEGLHWVRDRENGGSTRKRAIKKEE